MDRPIFRRSNNVSLFCRRFTSSSLHLPFLDAHQTAADGWQHFPGLDRADNDHQDHQDMLGQDGQRPLSAGG